MYVRDAFAVYLESARVGAGSPRTVDLYQRLLYRVADFAERRGRWRLEQLTLEVARAAIMDLRGDPDDQHQRRQHAQAWKGGEAMGRSTVCALRAFGAWARAEGLVVPDYRRLPLPKVPERIQPRVTPDEFRAIEAAILRRLIDGGRGSRFLVARDLSIINLLADTGLRASECCALDLADVDLDVGSLLVQRGKGAKPRGLNLRDIDPTERGGGPTLRALRDYLGYRRQTFGMPREQGLWLTQKGARLRPDGLREMLARVCDEAGLEGSRPPHAFRRGHFTQAYADQPTSLPMLTQRMGWSPNSRKMIEVYTRGAELDLAARTAMPLVSKRWRTSRDTPGIPPPRRADAYREGGPVERPGRQPSGAADSPRRRGRRPSTP